MIKKKNIIWKNRKSFYHWKNYIMVKLNNLFEFSPDCMQSSLHKNSICMYNTLFSKFLYKQKTKKTMKKRHIYTLYIVYAKHIYLQLTWARPLTVHEPFGCNSNHIHFSAFILHLHSPSKSKTHKNTHRMKFIDSKTFILKVHTIPTLLLSLTPYNTHEICIIIRFIVWNVLFAGRINIGDSNYAVR